MKRGFAQIVAGGMLLAGAGGCTSTWQTAAADVTPGGWEKPAEIRIENADSVTLRDADLFLRYDERFTEDTLTVRIATVAPDSLRFEESFLLAIARRDGPAALTRECSIPYRSRIRLTRTGEYRFIVTPLRPVRGVEAVGIRFSKSL